MKQTDQPKNTEYEDIYLPKNTGFGLYIAGASLAIGFALVWHIWWLAAVGLAGLLTLIIVRATAENTEYCLPAEEVARLERGA
jgi:cytochrome o ubiquinol oxidase subunit 1